MKKIQQINQYLLERYPTIWNTKIVWMLLASLAVHILFFFIGLVSHADPRSFHHGNVLYDFGINGLLYVHLLISLLLIVGWMVMMFRNNSFKNFYPSNPWKLFSQFLHYFIIILASSTFYFSYIFGLKTFVNGRYDDAKMKSYITTINNTVPFLSNEIESYTLNNRVYPKVFSQLYCESDYNAIDRSQKYFTYYDRVYQYWETYPKIVHLTQEQKNYVDYNTLIPEPEKSNKVPIAYRDDGEDQTVFHFKKNVVDVTPYLETPFPSYLNFSSVFYSYTENIFDRYNNSSFDPAIIDSEKSEGFAESVQINKHTVELLKKNNPKELEKLMNDFLNISNEFQISTNLTAKNWSKMVYNPEKFEIRHFIKRYKPLPNEEYYPDAIPYDYATNDVMAIDSAAVSVSASTEQDSTAIFSEIFNIDLKKEVSPKDYFQQNLTNFYYYDEQLKNFLKNVDNVKNSTPVQDDLYLYLWFAFVLAGIIFCYRVTGLRTLLFSIIGFGLLALFIALILVIINFGIGRISEYFVFYFVFIIATLILLASIFGMKDLKKIAVGILMNISIIGFAFWVLLIFGIISVHQQKACQDIITSNIYYYEDCPNILRDYYREVSCFAVLCGIIFIYFYTKVIHQWRAKSI